MPEAFAARVDYAGRLAGKLAFDDFAAGGPKVDIEFDVTVFKEFKVLQQNLWVTSGTGKSPSV
jgi:hypothetical protein